MRIMILNHQPKREGGPEYEARVAALSAVMLPPAHPLSSITLRTWAALR